MTPEGRTRWAADSDDPTRTAGERDTLPGPADPTFVRQLSAAVNLLRDPLRFLPQVRRRYGPVCGLPARRPRLVFVSGPEEARQILTDDAFVVDSFRQLRLRPGSPMMLLTNGLLRLNGAPHRRHRQAMRAAFAPRHVRKYTESMLRITDDVLDGWPAKGVVDLHDELATMVTRTSMSTMAGIDDRPTAERLHRLMVRLGAAAGNPLTYVVQAPLPGTPYRRMISLAAEIESLLREMITRRRAGHRGPDLLSRLAEPAADAAEPLDDDELIGEAYTALCQDSVASSLFWTLVLLDQHRAWWRAVRDEVADVVGRGRPTAELVENLPVMDQVIKESQRLFPPASFFVRYGTDGATIMGCPVRPGATVVISPFVAHRDPRAFPDPLDFRPERWSEPTLPGYFPFGLGAHACIGRSLALLEMKLVLTRIMQRCPVVLAPGSHVDPVVRISTVPGRPVHARVLTPGTVDVPDRGPVAGALNHMVRIT
jgi:cytochrome P450